MPEKTYFKPNRTVPRYFKACDAARIARQVVADDPETTPEEVLACIAKGFGFTHISLSRLRVVESVSLSKIPIKPILSLLEKLIMKLMEKSAVFKAALGPILALLRRALDILQRIDIPEPPQGAVDDEINPSKCRCKDRFIQPENEVFRSD